jgi:hypothetical protein
MSPAILDKPDRTWMKITILVVTVYAVFILFLVLGAGFNG